MIRTLGSVIHRFDVHCKTVEKTTKVSCHKPSGDKIIYHGLPKIHEYSESELSVENSFISQRRRNDEVVRPIERHDTPEKCSWSALCAVVKLPLVVRFD
jgi:hypothetical protein